MNLSEHSVRGGAVRVWSRSANPDAVVKKRPKDRKAQIASAAAIVFGERGYHAVSVDDIASSVGISGSALYRHFPNKYSLFRHSAFALTDALIGALDGVADNPVESERERLQRSLLAVIRTTIRNRRTAGIYRWESRFLEAPDRVWMRTQVGEINHRVGLNLSTTGKLMSQSDKMIVVAAMFSAIGSVTVHNLVLPQRAIERVLLDACLSIDQGGIDVSASPSERMPLSTLATSNKRESLMREAVRLFDSRGYHDVSIEEIAAAAGLNASGMYRYFPSKADLLAAVFYRAADRLDLATASVLDSVNSPAEALNALCSVYVDLSFAQNDLMSVYFSEMNNLLPGHRTDLRNRQKLYVLEWARLLGEVRPGLSAVEAKFVVHAALNLVPDVGRAIRFDAEPENALKLRRLMTAVLFGSQDL